MAKKHKRSIPNFILRIPEGEEFNVEALLDNQPSLIDVVKEETFKSIQEAFNTKKREAVLFNIPSDDYNEVEELVTIKKEKWGSSLKSILPFFEEKEKWNQCIEIREMIKELT